MAVSSSPVLRRNRVSLRSPPSGREPAPSDGDPAWSDCNLSPWCPAAILPPAKLAIGVFLCRNLLLPQSSSGRLQPVAASSFPSSRTETLERRLPLSQVQESGLSKFLGCKPGLGFGLLRNLVVWTAVEEPKLVLVLEFDLRLIWEIAR